MKKLFVMMALMIAISAPAFAGLVNGDFSAGLTGWTNWGAGWGGPYTRDASSGALIQTGGSPTAQGSFGVYQVVAIAAGTVVSVSADWAGDIGGAGWAEVMLYTRSDGGSNWANIADTGAAADISFKKDSWGMNPPTAWDWESISLAPHPSGNGGTVISQGWVCVATKLGASGQPIGMAAWDNIQLNYVPEPGSMLALMSGLGALLAIRRRK